uniref:Uncharacterized protein n=1 Tax=Arundo donax TaxID=35708 RepID=A0A0A9C495_ARUDO
MEPSILRVCVPIFCQCECRIISLCVIWYWSVCDDP